jgi:hypothetical protein
MINCQVIKSYYPNDYIPIKIFDYFFLPLIAKASNVYWILSAEPLVIEVVFMILRCCHYLMHVLLIDFGNLEAFAGASSDF